MRGRLLGHPVTHWSVVPSLPARPGEHPLRRLVAQAAHGDEVRLLAAAVAPNPRSISPAHYTANAVPDGSHVLLIDDTWTSGGHAQSAVLAIQHAGAELVSLLVVARWVVAGFGDNDAFLRERRTRDYDPTLCPWTGGACP